MTHPLLFSRADGIATLRCNAKDKNGTPYLIAARRADDLSYLRLQQSSN